ncbi:MAG: hypothetical protein ACE5KT_11710 [Methanosarcinales archaeon]
MKVNYNGRFGIDYSQFTIAYIKGNFNGNGRVDIGDAIYVAYMVVGDLNRKVPVNMDADFNNNGRIDIGDAAKIAYYVVGKVDSLACIKSFKSIKNIIYKKWHTKTKDMILV